MVMEECALTATAGHRVPRQSVKAGAVKATPPKRPAATNVFVEKGEEVVKWQVGVLIGAAAAAASAR